MSDHEQQDETYDMYDKFDCEVEEETKTVEVKEEEDSEIDDDALKGVDQSAGNESMIKTEDQDETSIDMFDDEFYVIMERDFSAKTNANETSEAVSVNEKHETDSDATEIDEDSHSAVSESQQNIEPVVIRSSSSVSGEQRLNGRQRRSKSHKCQQCSKSFSFPSLLKSHQLVLHTRTRAYKCSICSKSFGQKSTLKIHKQSHGNVRAHKCTTCSKSFSRLDVLKEHQRLHTGVKAHQCAYCSKSFAQKSNLTAHQAVHSDSRPFQCPICEKTFILNSYLKEHLQKVHHQ